MLTGLLLHRLAAKRKGKGKERKRDLGGKIKMGIRIVIVLQGIRYIPRAKKIIYCVVQSTNMMMKANCSSMPPLTEVPK